MDHLTLGQLNTMDLEKGRKALEKLGYRLTSQNEEWKRGRTYVHATFRSTAGSVFFTHSFKEKRNGEKIDEIIQWEFKLL